MSTATLQQALQQRLSQSLPGEMPLVPQEGESEADFSWRVHQEMSDTMGTDAAQQLAFDIWDEANGASDLLEIGQRQFPAEQYRRIDNVVVFVEHTGQRKKAVKNTKTGKTEVVPYTEIYDRRGLEAIAARCNHRISDTGDFSPLVDGHTFEPDDLAQGAKQAEVLGYDGPFRVGLFGNENPRWAIYATEWHHNDSRGKLAKLRRRSPELWEESKMEDRFFDPIAALGAETPRLDTGIAKMCRNAAGRLVVKYSAMAFPGGGNTFIPSDDLKKNIRPRSRAIFSKTPSTQLFAATSQMSNTRPNSERAKTQTVTRVAA